MDLGELYFALRQRAGDAASRPGRNAEDLPLLRAALAALVVEGGGGDDAAAAAAPQPPPPANQALTGAIELLCAALAAPPRELFADEGSGAPRAPTDAAAAAAYQEATVLRLRLVGALLPRLGRVEIDGGDGGSGAAAARPPLRRRPDDFREDRGPPVVGIVEITEVTADGDEDSAGGGSAPASDAARRDAAAAALRAAALFAHMRPRARFGCFEASGCSNGSSPEGGAEAAVACVVPGPALASLMRRTARAALALPSPWADAAAARAAAAAVRALERSILCGDAQGGGGAVLAAAVDEWLLPALRGPLLAPHRHAQAQERGATDAYEGPDPFERALAARRLAWAAQQLAASGALSAAATGPDDASDAAALALGRALPLALAASDDAAACVARFGHAALHALAVGAPRAALQPHRELLLARARKLVVGCEPRAWASAAPAAAQLVLAAEPPLEPRAEGCHALLRELLTESERGAHHSPQRAATAACLGALLPRLRLCAARHLSRLAPLLLEWLLAPDEKARRAALAALDCLLRCCWPRVPAHGAVFWRHLVAAARNADAFEWRRRRGVDEEEEDEEGDGDGSDGGGDSGSGSGSDDDDDGGGKARTCGDTRADDEAAAFVRVGRLLVALCGREAMAAVCCSSNEGKSGRSLGTLEFAVVALVAQ